MTNARFPGLVKMLPYTPERGAEIGVNRGETAEALLREFPSLYLIMVDRWGLPGGDETYRASGDPLARRSLRDWSAVYRDAVRRTDFAHERRRIIVDGFEDASARAGNGSLDFVFLDADHSYEGTRRAIGLWAPKVRPGGLVCGHDYDAPWEHTKGVTQAVDEAVERWGVELLRADPYIWGWIQP